MAPPTIVQNDSTGTGNVTLIIATYTLNPPQNKTKIVCIAKADSGTSNHFWRKEDADTLHYIQNEDGPSLKIPNSTTINDKKLGYIPLSKHLSPPAQRTRILSDLKSASLTSLGQLADDGCTTKVKKKDLIVKKDGNIILTGKKTFT